MISVNDPHLSSSASAAPSHESVRALLRPAMAELIGSALFVFIACGAGMTTVKYQTVVRNIITSQIKTTQQCNIHRINIH